MLFIHIITALLISVALLSLRADFGDPKLFILFIIFGLATSWWQQKRNKFIPNLRIILNVIFLVLAIKALLPFFIDKPTDILTGLIKTWIYFLILSTFTIYSTRDYYLTQVLSLGLLVFSCFNQNLPKINKLGYILVFFIIWIISLRSICISQDIIKETKKTFHPKKRFYPELKIGIIFTTTIIVIVIPLYLLIPRLNIPVPFYLWVEQKYNISYADFPKGIISFFSPSIEKAPQQQEEKEKRPAGKITQRAEERLVDLQKFKIKPIFWYSSEEYQSMLEELKIRLEQDRNETDKINKELQELSPEEETATIIKESIMERERLKQREEELVKNIGELQKEQTLLKEKYLAAIEEQSEVLITEPENKELLKKLGGGIIILEGNLSSTTKKLKILKEELHRIIEMIDEVGTTVYQQLSKIPTAIRNQMQKMWAKKEVLEEKLASLKNEIETRQEEFKEYNQLIQEEKIEPLTQPSPEEYQNILKKLENRIEQNMSEITQINKELQELSQRTKVTGIKESILRRKRLMHRKEELVKKIKQLQKQLTLLKEKYRKAIERQSEALKTEPENKELLKSMEEEIQTLEKDSESTTRILEVLEEELGKIIKRIDEVRAVVYRKLMKIPEGIQIEKKWVKKEILEEKLEYLKSEVERAQELFKRTKMLDLEEQKKRMEEVKEEKRRFSIFDLLIRFLILVIFSILLFLIYCVIAFFLPYLREKRKFKKASFKNQYNLAIIVLYNFLCRVLNLFGYKYPVVIDPEEHLDKLGQRFKSLQTDCSKITGIFMEARYSTHKLIKNQLESVIYSYRNILKELKNIGSFWQKLLLKLNFVFKL